MAYSLTRITRLLKRRPYTVVPPSRADTVNDIMLRMSRDDGGGWVVLRGTHRPSEPYRVQPGIRLTSHYHPTMYSRTPNIEPRFEGLPVFVLTDGVDYGSRKAWGGATIEGFQIFPSRPGLTALQVVGGNGSRVRQLSSAYGKYPLQHGLLVGGGREHDGQYSVFEQLRFTRVLHGATWAKNAPDCVLRDSMFYGGGAPGSTGLVSGGNNLTVENTHWQFYDRGLEVKGKETKIIGGSWENRSGRSPYAEFAFKVGPQVEDLLVSHMSFANLSSLRDRRVFDLSSTARHYTFLYPTGHVRPDDVPQGFEKHFVWHA